MIIWRVMWYTWGLYIYIYIYIYIVRQLGNLQAKYQLARPRSRRVRNNKIILQQGVVLYNVWLRAACSLVNTVGSIKGRCLLDQSNNCQRFKKPSSAQLKVSSEEANKLFPKRCCGIVCSGNAKGHLLMNISWQNFSETIVRRRRRMRRRKTRIR
jgi:hypothetical protein